MSKFGYIESNKTRGDKTVDYTINDIIVNDKSPVLTVRPAQQINKPYFNAVLRKMPAAQRRAQRLKPGELDEMRAADFELYAQHIVTGWKNVFAQENGEIKEVAFSKENCKEFLEAIDVYMFDDLREFCTNPANFGTGVTLDAETKAKN